MKKWLWVLVMVCMLGTVGGRAEENAVRITGEKILKAGQSEVAYVTVAFDQAEAAEAVNEDMKTQAQKMLASYELEETTLQVSCEAISLMGGTVLSLRFSGEVSGEKLAHPSRIYYTLNYDLSTGKRMTLREIGDPGEIAKAIVSGGYEFEKSEKESDAYYEAQAAYLKDLGQRELTSMLRNADVWKEQAAPQAFSYWKGDGTCIISVELPYALGEFAHMQFAYQK